MWIIEPSSTTGQRNERKNTIRFPIRGFFITKQRDCPRRSLSRDPSPTSPPKARAIPFHRVNAGPRPPALLGMEAERAPHRGSPAPTAANEQSATQRKQPIPCVSGAATGETRATEGGRGDVSGGTGEAGGDFSVSVFSAQCDAR